MAVADARGEYWEQPVETAAPEELAELQLDRLKAQLRRLHERSPFYRRRLADAGGEKAGFVIAEVDAAKIAEARKMVPSLTHDRKYAAPVLHKPAVAKAAE